MNLSLDEQRLLAEFRKLPPAGQDELLAFAGTLLRRSTTGSVETGKPTNQCALKSKEQRPEAADTPLFTE